MADESSIWDVGCILAWIEGFLRDRGDVNPRLSAQWLVSEAIGCSRIELYADLRRPLSESERATLRDWTRRRGAGEPLQYLTGSTDFRFITVKVRPGVLIPRPETEVLVSEALEAVKTPGRFVQEGPDPSLRIVDAGTGSGCIACSLASELASARVLAGDVSPAALELARENVADLGLSDRVRVVESDLLAAVPEAWHGRTDLVISNPPYIPSVVLEGMDAEVTGFEPALALDGGADGLDLYRRLVPQALEVLAPRGVLAVELHETCLEQAARLAREAGFAEARIASDLAARPRVLVARKGSPTGLS